MSNISLSMCNAAKSTVISNRFIDDYMPKANGSYVKIYIYLLRCATDPASDMSLSYIADRLEETEKDIIRALTYWEEEGVISIKRDSFNRITDIKIANLERVREPAGPAPVSVAPAKEAPVVPLFGTTPEKTIPADDLSVPGEAPFGIEEVSACSGVPEQRPTYSDTQVAQLCESDEIKWLLQMLEHRLSRLIKPADVQLVLFFYECLGFNADLIIHLYDYCLSRGKKSNAYIEKVAISWASDGISTVEQAMERTSSRNLNFSAVLTAFGLNRTPVPAEQQYMKRWFETFRFDAELVTEACNRTVLTIGKPDFKYADRILENWYKQGIKSTAELVAYDQAHEKRAQNRGNIARPFQKPSNNLFNRFPQRNYSEEDYTSMEQRLLNKQQG